MSVTLTGLSGLLSKAPVNVQQMRDLSVHEDLRQHQDFFHWMCIPRFFTPFTVSHLLYTFFFCAILSVSKLSAFFCGVTFCVVRSAVSSQESCEECCEECRDECSEECCECRYILGIFFWHYFFALEASKL